MCLCYYSQKKKKKKKKSFVCEQMALGIGWIFIKALKSLKNCTFYGLFLSKALKIKITKRKITIRKLHRDYLS